MNQLYREDVFLYQIQAMFMTFKIVNVYSIF